MSRFLTILLLSAALGCAAAPAPEPDAVEPCGAAVAQGEAAWFYVNSAVVDMVAMR